MAKIPKLHDERLAMLPEKYFLALGHLQYAYTTLEVNLAHQIKNLVTVGYNYKENPLLFTRIDAILGGMRMGDCKDVFKRLLRVMDAPPELVAYIDTVFAHLTELQFFRNRLTHYTTLRWPPKRGPYVNSDAGLAKEDKKIITMRFRHNALEAARHDLHAAIHYMEQAIPDEDHGMILEPPTWQYKPSMLAR